MENGQIFSSLSKTVSSSDQDIVTFFETVQYGSSCRTDIGNYQLVCPLQPREMSGVQHLAAFGLNVCSDPSTLKVFRQLQKDKYKGGKGVFCVHVTLPGASIGGVKFIPTESITQKFLDKDFQDMLFLRVEHSNPETDFVMVIYDTKTTESYSNNFTWEGATINVPLTPADRIPRVHLEIHGKDGMSEILN